MSARVSATCDIVLPVKEGNVNEELRYALRSLENLPHRNVYIVGGLPKWVKNVVHVPSPVREGKRTTVLHHLLAACCSRRLSDWFILMNDDFFIMEQLDDLPLLHRGPMEKVLKEYKDKRSTYYASMKKAYEALGDDPISYELHVPMWIHKQGFTEAIKRYDLPPGQHRSIFGNFIELGGEEIEDVKIRNSGDPIPDGPFLSSKDGTFYRVRPLLEHKFPNEGPYEA